MIDGFTPRHMPDTLLAGRSLLEESAGIFGFADLANFWFGFPFFALKNCGFSVLVSFGLRVFSNLMFGFRFWQQ